MSRGRVMDMDINISRATTAVEWERVNLAHCIGSLLSTLPILIAVSLPTLH
jgi:hypothetical protein